MSEPIRLKIVSDGRFGSGHTQVVDQVTGRPIEGVQGVSWQIDKENMAGTAVITVVQVPVEITTGAVQAAPAEVAE